jgi:hypothetical protein
MRRDQWRRVADPLLVPLGELVIPRLCLRHAPTLTGSARIAICLAVRFPRKPSSGQSTRWQACAAPSRIPALPRPTGSRERGCESRPHISDSAGLARSAPTDSGMHHQRRKRQWPPAVTVMARMYPPSN